MVPSYYSKIIYKSGSKIWQTIIEKIHSLFVCLWVFFIYRVILALLQSIVWQINNSIEFLECSIAGAKLYHRPRHVQHTCIGLYRFVH